MVCRHRRLPPPLRPPPPLHRPPPPKPHRLAPGLAALPPLLLALTWGGGAASSVCLVQARLAEAAAFAVRTRRRPRHWYLSCSLRKQEGGFVPVCGELHTSRSWAGVRVEQPGWCEYKSDSPAVAAPIRSRRSGRGEVSPSAAPDRDVVAVPGVEPAAGGGGKREGVAQAAACCCGDSAAGTGAGSEVPRVLVAGTPGRSCCICCSNSAPPSSLVPELLAAETGRWVCPGLWGVAHISELGWCAGRAARLV